jgi:hypothetical protein
MYPVSEHYLEDILLLTNYQRGSRPPPALPATGMRELASQLTRTPAQQLPPPPALDDVVVENRWGFFFPN